MLDFAFCEGGAYRMRLTYNEPQHSPGKTSEDDDEVEVRFVKLVQDRRIEQAVGFKSEDPAFSGEMRITWALEPMNPLLLTRALDAHDVAALRFAAWLNSGVRPQFKDWRAP